jgi:hypothetical protein
MQFWPLYIPNDFLFGWWKRAEYKSPIFASKELLDNANRKDRKEYEDKVDEILNDDKNWVYDKFPMRRLRLNTFLLWVKVNWYKDKNKKRK